jgi:hypothetical protein
LGALRKDVDPCAGAIELEAILERQGGRTEQSSVDDAGRDEDPV